MQSWIQKNGMKMQSWTLGPTNSSTKKKSCMLVQQESTVRAVNTTAGGVARLLGCPAEHKLYLCAGVPCPTSPLYRSLTASGMPLPRKCDFQPGLILQKLEPSFHTFSEGPPGQNFDRLLL